MSPRRKGRAGPLQHRKPRRRAGRQGGGRARAGALRRWIWGVAWALFLLFPAPVVAAVYAGSQTPGGLAWIVLTDTRGISVWNYELSLDRGGGVIPNPGKWFWSSLVDLLWGFYKAWVVLAIAFLDWVMSLEWLSLAASPFILVGDAMESVLRLTGVAGTFAVVAGVAAILWMAKGQWATGAWELTVTLVIGALAAGVFAHPVRLIAGPDGWIAKVQTQGQEVGTLLTGAPPGVEAGRSKQMVDVFIRKPLQLINFGQIVDGTPCEKAYTNVVRGGPYGGESDIRDAVGDCDEDLGEYAENPSPSMVLDAFLMSPGGGILMLLLGSIGGSILLAGVVLLWEGAKGAYTLIVGLLPGAARGPLLASVGTVLTRLALLFGVSIAIGLVMLLVTALMESGDSTAKVFLTVDAVLIVAVMVWWRQHRNLKASSQRISSALAQRPGASPVRLPPPTAGPSLGSVANSGLRAAQLLATRRAASAAGGIYNNQQGFYSNQQQLVVLHAGGGRVPPPPGRRPPPPRDGMAGPPPRQLPPGPGPSGPAGPAPSGPPRIGGGAGGRGRGRIRRVVGYAATAGSTIATGGSSHALRTARVAARARAARSASQSAMRPGPVNSSPSASAGPVVPGRVIRSTGPDGRITVSRSEPPRDAP